MTRPCIAALACCLLPLGCTVGPDYASTGVDVPGAFAEASSTYGGSSPARVELAGWWRSLEDPTLDALVARAIDANLDLRVATARIGEAWAQRGVVAADALPQIDAVGDYAYARESENLGRSEGFRPTGDPTNRWTLGLEASWELDVWGRVRRGVEAAEADVGVAVENRRDVLVSVVAETALAYAELRGFQRRLALAAQNADLQRETLALTRSRYEAGLTSELDVVSAAAQLAATEAAIPAFRQGATEAIHRLGVLLGAAPETLRSELAIPAPIPVGPTAIDPGTPEQLVQRRPDLRRADREAAAASARIGVATADLYPRIVLLGDVGLGAEDFDALFNSASHFYSIGPRITWAVFDGDRIRSNIAVQDARFEQARLVYLATILAALEEVENALAAHRHEQERAASLESAVRSNQQRVALATERYERGIGDFLSVLDAQRALTLAEDDLALARQRVASNVVAVFRALGGA